MAKKHQVSKNGYCEQFMVFTLHYRIQCLRKYGNKLVNMLRYGELMQRQAHKDKSVCHSLLYMSLVFFRIVLQGKCIKESTS